MIAVQKISLKWIALAQNNIYLVSSERYVNCRENNFDKTRMNNAKKWCRETRDIWLIEEKRSMAAPY